MTRNTTLLLIILISLSTKAFSQTALPYHMGFDSAGQTSWHTYRAGVATSYSWGWSNIDQYAGAGKLYHDYPVGNAGTDTTIDWYISPAFHFATGGRIDSLKVNAYIIATLTPVDFIGVYLLSGSADPSAATSTTLLADLSYMASGSTMWRDTGHIAIPPTAGQSYLAFKYRATNNWFTIGIDELYVSGNTSSGIITPTSESALTLCPNPSDGSICIKGIDKNDPAHEVQLSIYDAAGRLMYEQQKYDGQSIHTNLPDGLYLYSINKAGIKSNGKLSVKH